MDLDSWSHELDDMMKEMGINPEDPGEEFTKVLQEVHDNFLRTGKLVPIREIKEYLTSRGLKRYMEEKSE